METQSTAGNERSREHEPRLSRYNKRWNRPSGHIMADELLSSNEERPVSTSGAGGGHPRVPGEYASSPGSAVRSTCLNCGESIAKHIGTNGASLTTECNAFVNPHVLRRRSVTLDSLNPYRL